MKVSNISEYQVQDIIERFLFNNLNGLFVNVDKEKFGKYDVVVEQNGMPLILFELKTFLKPTEKLQTESNFEKIFKDVKKLYEGKKKFKCRSYLIIVIHKRNIKESLNKNFEFIFKRLSKDKKWYSIKGIKLRPSVMDFCNRVYSFSWEVK